MCNDNQLIALNFNQSSCPCTELVYNFTIVNTGTQIESYVFGLDTFSEFANVSINPLVLGPGEENTVKLYLKPDCGIFGDYIVNFYSIAQSSGIKTKVPILAHIDRCYDFDIIAGKAVVNSVNKYNASFVVSDQHNFCALDNMSIPIMIDNAAFIGNNYFYSLDGPSFGSFYGNVLRLNGYENGLIFLDLSPGVADVGEHKFTVSVESQVGEEKRQKVVDVNVE